MNNAMVEFMEVLKGNPSHAYDFICNEYYRMSKDELKDIAKELLYAIYEFHTERIYNDILHSVADELNDWYGDLEE